MNHFLITLAFFIVTGVSEFIVTGVSELKTVDQPYSQNESKCVTHTFKESYGFANGDDLFTNHCAYAVKILVIFNRNHNGAYQVDLEPQASGGTGHSKALYDEMGGALFHVCRAGYRPVDMDGKRIYATGTEEYQCQKQ